MIKTETNGEIDYEDLRETLRIHRDVPPIIVANIGTTMKGAVDDVDKIRGILHDFAVPSFYTHCDVAERVLARSEERRRLATDSTHPPE